MYLKYKRKKGGVCLTVCCVRRSIGIVCIGNNNWLGSKLINCPYDDRRLSPSHLFVLFSRQFHETFRRKVSLFCKGGNLPANQKHMPAINPIVCSFDLFLFFLDSFPFFIHWERNVFYQQIIAFDWIVDRQKT